MSFLHDSVRDGGLQVITDATSKEMHICTSEPTSRADCLTKSLGQKTGYSVGSPVDGDTNGRKVVCAAITDGAVDTTGTAFVWALISGTVLLASEDLLTSQVVTTPNTFTLPATDITKPDA